MIGEITPTIAAKKGSVKIVMESANADDWDSIHHYNSNWAGTSSARSSYIKMVRLGDLGESNNLFITNFMSFPVIHGSPYTFFQGFFQLINGRYIPVTPQAFSGFPMSANPIPYYLQLHVSNSITHNGGAIDTEVSDTANVRPHLDLGNEDYLWGQDVPFWNPTLGSRYGTPANCTAGYMVRMLVEPLHPDFYIGYIFTKQSGGSPDFVSFALDSTIVPVS